MHLPLYIIAIWLAKRGFYAGEPGDRVQFTEFVTANVRLYALRNEQRLSTHAVAHYTRQQLAEALRRV